MVKMKETIQLGLLASKWAVRKDSSHGSANVYINSNQSAYPYSMSLELVAYGHGRACEYRGYGIVGLRNAEPIENLNYISFIARDYYLSRSSRGSGAAYLYLYDENGNEIAHYTLGGTSSGYLNSNHDHDLYELFLDSGNLYLVINGDSKGIIGTFGGTPKYFEIVAAGYGNSSCGFPQYNAYCTTHLRVDDITTNDDDEGFIGIGVESHSQFITELNDPVIDVSYHMKTLPWDAYVSARYTIIVQNVSTGNIVETILLKEANESAFIEPKGLLSFNRDTLFTDGYGLYSFNLTMDGRIISTDYLYFVEIPPPTECNQELVVTYYNSPVYDAMVKIYDSDSYLYAEMATDENGLCVIGLDTKRLYYAHVYKGERSVTSPLFIPCADNPLEVKLDKPGPNGDGHNLLVILATVGASLTATYLSGKFLS